MENAAGHEDERWLPVIGYEGIYEVSDHGRVRSLPRMAPARRGPRRVPGGLLKPISRGKYYKVNLSDGREIRGFDIHVLVLTAFRGPCLPGKEGCHADDVGSNNRLTNLRWDTHAENFADARRNKRSNHHAAKTHCKYEHLLGGANRTNRAIALDRRDCLACQRGRSAVNSAARNGWVLDFRTAADRAYRTIMA
jgi:hypothetical protein